jgi:hypothetical protein
MKYPFYVLGARDPRVRIVNFIDLLKVDDVKSNNMHNEYERVVLGDEI